MKQVKKFKDYERIYPHLVGSLALNQQEKDTSANLFRSYKNCWPHANVYKVWAQRQVIYAVYEAPDHEEWQKFRIGLKKLPTQHKLFRLHQRWMNVMFGVTTEQHKLLEHVRIDNYLGALIRGGQLSSRLEILR